MGFRAAIQNGLRQGIKGCLAHLLAGIFALVLIAVIADFYRLSDLGIFIIMTVAVVLILVLVPWKREKRQ
jgi:sugar phosphate permease